MARVVKDAEERRAEILDAAQGFFYTKGYDETSIQDIIDAVQIAKGTFYHYFDSKTDLLNALIDRISRRNLEYLLPIVEDQQLGALDKLNQYFSRSQALKTTNREILKVWLRVMYKDENVLLRHKVLARGVELIAPNSVRSSSREFRKRCSMWNIHSTWHK